MSFSTRSFTSGTGTQSTSAYLSAYEREEGIPAVVGRIRAFPFKPTPEPGSLTDFVEETGTNAILVDALQKLFAVPTKPENPIEWLRLYFQYQAPDSTKEMKQLEMLLKAELTDIQAEIMNSLELQAQNQAIIQKLEREVKNIKMDFTKNQYHDDFRKYKHHPDNYHYRIRPDPSYQPSKTDLLLSHDEEKIKREDSLVELIPFDPGAFLFESENLEGKVPYDKLYEDYPAVYFPEYQTKPPSGIEPEEDIEDSEEASEGAEETEYDAGSEGGESEESRHSRGKIRPSPKHKASK